MSTDPVDAWLAELGRLHAASTPGDRYAHGLVMNGQPVTIEGPRAVVKAIVAVHNALPALLTMVAGYRAAMKPIKRCCEHGVVTDFTELLAKTPETWAAEVERG